MPQPLMTHQLLVPWMCLLMSAIQRYTQDEQLLTARTQTAFVFDMFQTRNLTQSGLQLYSDCWFTMHMRITDWWLYCRLCPAWSRQTAVEQPAHPSLLPFRLSATSASYYRQLHTVHDDLHRLSSQLSCHKCKAHLDTNFMLAGCSVYCRCSMFKERYSCTVSQPERRGHAWQRQLAMVPQVRITTFMGMKKLGCRTNMETGRTSEHHTHMQVCI